MRKLVVVKLLAIFGAPSLLLAAWRLDYEVVETRTPPPNPPPKAETKLETKKYALQVWLDEEAMVVAGEDTTQWWNFKERTVTTLNREKHTLDRVNLLATLGFRQAEFLNRQRLGAALGAAGIKDGSFEPVLVEHLFGLRAPKSPGPTLTMRGTDELWTHAGKTLFRITRSGPEWSAGHRRAWLRFVVYRYGLHPDIIAALEKRSTVPAEMEIGRMNVREDRFGFNLQRALVEDFPAPPALEGGADQETRVGKLVHAASHMEAADYRAACARLRESFEAAHKAGRVLDGTLLMLEWGLWTDELTPEVIGRYREQINANAECRELFTALNPRSKAAAENAVATLLELEGKTGEARRVLRIFRANSLSKLGKFAEACRLFEEVLAETPANVGAWKDLGDLYYGAYEMPDAWRCWDTAKRLLPTHKNLKPVLELEARLIAENQTLL